MPLPSILLRAPGYAKRLFRRKPPSAADKLHAHLSAARRGGSASLRPFAVPAAISSVVTPLEYAGLSPFLDDGEGMYSRLRDMDPAAAAEMLLAMATNAGFYRALPGAVRRSKDHTVRMAGNLIGTAVSTPAIDITSRWFRTARTAAQEGEESATGFGNLMRLLAPVYDEEGEMTSKGHIVDSLERTEQSMEAFAKAMTRLNPWAQAGIVGALGLGTGALGLGIYDRMQDGRLGSAKKRKKSPAAPRATPRKPGHMRVDIPADRISPQFYQALSRDMMFNNPPGGWDEEMARRSGRKEDDEDSKKAASIAVGYFKRAKYDGKRTFINSNLTNRWDSRVLDEINQGRRLSPDEMMQLKSQHLENKRLEMEMDQQGALAAGGMAPPPPPLTGASTSTPSPTPAPGYVMAPGSLMEHSQQLKQRVMDLGKSASIDKSANWFRNMFIDPVMNIPGHLYGMQHQARRGNWRDVGRHTVNLGGDALTTGLNLSIPFTGGAALGLRGAAAGLRGAVGRGTAFRSSVRQRPSQPGRRRAADLRRRGRPGPHTQQGFGNVPQMSSFPRQGGQRVQGPPQPGRRGWADWRNFAYPVGYGVGYHVGDTASTAGRGDSSMPGAVSEWQSSPDMQQYYQATGFQPISPDRYMTKYQSVKRSSFGMDPHSTRDTLSKGWDATRNWFNDRAVESGVFWNNRRQDLQHGSSALGAANPMIPGGVNLPAAKPHVEQMPTVRHGQDRYHQMEDERAQNLSAEDALKAEHDRYNRASQPSGWDMMQYLPMLLPFLAPFLQGGGGAAQQQHAAPGYGRGGHNAVAHAYNQWA